jgi:hypothetical protein
LFVVVVVVVVVAFFTAIVVVVVVVVGASSRHLVIHTIKIVKRRQKILKSKAEVSEFGKDGN